MALTALLLHATLAAHPASGPSAAAVGFQAVSVDEKKAAFLGEYFAQQLSKASGMPITTPSQIAAVVGIEKQKQLLGCSDQSTSCLAELAGALGANAIITGSVAQIGKQYAVNVKIVRGDNGREIAAASDNIPLEDDLLPWLKSTAKELSPRLLAEFSDAAPAPQVSSSGGSLRSKAYIPLAVGAVAAAGAVVLEVLAHGKAAEMRRAETTPTASAAASTGSTYQTAAVAAGIAGAALLATGTAMALFGGGGSPQVAVAPLPSGAAVAIGGSF